MFGHSPGSTCGSPSQGTYRRAAASLESLDRGVTEVLEQGGVDGLRAIPGIGSTIAAAIREMARTGRWAQLERVRGELDPVKLFQTVPGIGPELARRIHDALHLDTLEALEVAAHDGRLDGVEAIGPRRIASIRASLAAMLQRIRGTAGRFPGPTAAMEPGVDRAQAQPAR